MKRRLTTKTETAEKSSWRFELKYRINRIQYSKAKIALLPHMKSDFYTMGNEKNRYLVRSLYFDTYEYALYHEKMSGDRDRIKFRLRTYQRELNDALIKVEMKVRMANAMEKLVEKVSAEEYCYFIKTKRWPEHNSPVLNEFERYIHLKALKPQVLVEYEREGYEDRNRAGIRVTFDHRVRSAHAADLFPTKKLFYREHHPQGVIMEIKCREKQPYWLHGLVRDYGLKLVANSKFTQGIQIARQDLYHPNGVVVIR